MSSNSSFKEVVRCFVPEKVRRWMRRGIPPHARLSFSQEGEDMILARFFETHGPGFYVDVGAHDPQRFSNTYYFYLQGWRGINIDAMPGSMERFRHSRPRDINVESAVARERKTLVYHMFNEPALNGCSEDLSRERNGLRDFREVNRQEIQAEPLAGLLERHLPAGQQIDFMSVDVEGMDLEVLQSNDWTRHRPRCLVVEDLPSQGKSVSERSEMQRFLEGQGYIPLAKTIHSLLLVRQD